MILDEESSPVSERSPLKSPSSPVTARYDSSSSNGTNTQQLSPPPYFTQEGNLNSGLSSSHHPHHPHPHPHPHSHTIEHPYSPYVESHLRNGITYDEYKAIRRRALRRFFVALLIAWLIVVVWSGIIESIALTIHNARGNAISPEAWLKEQLHSLPSVRWPHPYSNPGPVVVPCPTVTVTATPEAGRYLSIAYPPPLQTPS